MKSLSKVTTTTYSTMVEQAEYLVQAKMVPFDNPADVLIALQAAKDYRIPVISALSGVHNIKGKIGLSSHIIGALLMRSGIFYEILEDCEPVTHYITRGGNPVVLTARQYMADANKYHIVTTEEWEAGKADPSKIPLIEQPAPYINDNLKDTRTTIRFTRMFTFSNGVIKEFTHNQIFFLHEAYRAGYMGVGEASKEVWYAQTPNMTYSRCLTRGARRFAPDVVHNMYEVSELLDGTDIDYTTERTPEGVVVTILEDDDAVTKK